VVAGRAFGARAAGPSPSRGHRDAAGACPTRPAGAFRTEPAAPLVRTAGKSTQHRRGDQHGIHPRTRRRLRLAVASAAVLAALTVATAGASPPTPMGDLTPMGAARLGAGPGQAPRASSPAPGFLLDRGRYVRLDVPGSRTSQAADINNRGQIVGFAPIADAAPSPQPTDPPPMGRMA
jgi:hypothetical protein